MESLPKMYYSPPLPRAVGENARTLGFLQTKAYTVSQKPKKNLAIFYIFLKEKHSSTSKEKINVVSSFYVCVFCSEIGTRYTLCVRYTLCDGGPSLGAKSGLSDDFFQYFFLRTPSGNRKGDKGLRDLLESDF
jgi:hypothetical protein